MATKIDIGGELNPRTVEGIVADASTIIDRTAEKRQDEINSEVSESLEAKQDVIADLETIRSGAASGSTAIQPTQIEDVVHHVDTGALEPLLDPSDYATTDQLNQLEHKVSDISTGKYYGYYATANDLPDDSDVDGFAYVGTGPTYTIYNCRSGAWTSSGLTVNQSPIGNDEDIDQDTSGKLQFANRTYNAQQPNGMGYKILRKDATFASQVTDTNTIYEIRYDFDLNSGTLSLPSGSILKFNGGTIKNTTITGDNTAIDAGNVKVFDNVIFAGTFVGALNACWLGAVADDDTFDNSAIIQDWFDNYSSFFRELYFPLGKYYFLSPTTLTSDKRDLVLNGCNSKFLVNIADDGGNGQYFLSLSNLASGSSGEQFLLKDAVIESTRYTSSAHLSKTRGLLLDRTQRFSISNVQFWFFDIGVVLCDCWYGGFYNNTLFRDNRIGVLAKGITSYETNTVEFMNIDFSGASRSSIEAVWPQDSGETNDEYVMRTASVGFDTYTLLQGVCLRGCVFENFDFGIRTNCKKFNSNASVSGSTLVVDGNYFEANRVYDYFSGVGNYNSEGTGSSIIYYSHQVTISNCHFHGLKKVCLFGGYFKLINNDPNITVDAQDYLVRSSGQLSATVEYSGIIELGLLSGLATITKIGVGSLSWFNDRGVITFPATQLGKLQSSRSFDSVSNRLKDYDITGSTSGDYPVEYKPWNLCSEPGVDIGLDVSPLRYFCDKRNNVGMLLVPSGDGLVPVNCDERYNIRALNSYGDIPLFEFIRRWKAGINYTGTVQNLFPFPIVAKPGEGGVYDESGTLIGFGNNGVGSTFKYDMRVDYFLYVDALMWIRTSYSRAKFSCDHLQCGRTYREIRRGVDENYNTTAYLDIYTTNIANVQKRLNMIFFDTSAQQLKIYNGHEWVQMTSPFQRYYFVGYGTKLAERPTMADIPGQTFLNLATGIKYTFVFENGIGTNPVWLPSIGQVYDLSHPNGYVYDNTLDYANELSVGEQVMYNGALYKWDGTQLVALNP